MDDIGTHRISPSHPPSSRQPEVSSSTSTAAETLSPSPSPSPVDTTTTTTTTTISIANSASALKRTSTSSSPVRFGHQPIQPERLSRDNCDRRRPNEEEPPRGLIKMPPDLVGKKLSPFFKEHIPGIYAPIGKSNHKKSASSSTVTTTKDSNSKYCYRHRPDSKCRRAADETKMGIIQRELNSLPLPDQEAITHVWSLFSAAPSKHRELMLQGIITQCCFPQLSTVSREVQEQLKIDFLATLPAELSYKVLCYLDTVSLCKAAQVSRRWRALADDDVVWHRMCEQHIDRKCTKCGWGLPLLEKKKLLAWNRHRLTAHPEAVSDVEFEEASSPSQGSNKRTMVTRDETECVKRQRVQGSCKPRSQLEEERKFRPWKDVYRDRFKVGYNWKTGRCSVKTFKGHENGVTCLQMDDNILASGSYDTTIKIWNIETGEVIRTLRGHTSTVRSLQFDDSKLISGSFDKTIKIWNWQTGECLSTLQCHTEGLLSVHFEGLTLASGSIDKTVKIFSFDTKQTCTLRGHTDWVNHVRVDPASRTVFSASDDLSVKLWDLDSKQCIRTYLGHVGQVQQILLMPADFEPDEDLNVDRMEATSTQSDVRVTPSPSPSPEPMPADDRSAFGYGFTSDPNRPLPPRYMLTGGLDNTVRLWNVVTGKCVRSMFGHVEGIWGLVGDTLRVVTGANDSMAKIWEPRSGKCERSFTGHAGPVTCVGLSDSRMASGSEDGDIRLYSFEGENMEERGTPS